MQVLCGLQVVFFLFNCQTPAHFPVETAILPLWENKLK